MKIVLFGAGSDLGTHIDGSKLGPTQIKNDIESSFPGEIVEQYQENSIIKSRNLSDRKKNEYEIEEFNSTAYEQLVELKGREDTFVITVGGDDTVSIPSVLASKKVLDDIGLIYFTGSCLYDTYKTSPNGNMRDLTIASINDYKTEGMNYYANDRIFPGKTVIIGCREMTESENENLKYSGVNCITAKNIKEEGIEDALEKAFKLAVEKTKGVHIVFSLGFIDPEYAPGVSEPKFDGFDETIVTTIHEYLVKHIDLIVGYDLVDFNPLRDEDRKTEQIAVNCIASMVNAAQTKERLEKLEKKY